MKIFGLAAPGAAFLLGPLSGCVGAGAIAIDDAIEAHDAAREYVRSVHVDRRWIRDQCKSILDARVQELREAGRGGEGAALLAAAYPAPVTVELITEGKEVASDAYLCVMLEQFDDARSAER